MSDDENEMAVMRNSKVYQSSSAAHLKKPDEFKQPLPLLKQQDKQTLLTQQLQRRDQLMKKSNVPSLEEEISIDPDSIVDSVQ